MLEVNQGRMVHPAEARFGQQALKVFQVFGDEFVLFSHQVQGGVVAIGLAVDNIVQLKKINTLEGEPPAGRSCRD